MKKNYKVFMYVIFINMKLNIFSFIMHTQCTHTQTHYFLSPKITYDIKHFLHCFINITTMIINNLSYLLDRKENNLKYKYKNVKFSDVYLRHRVINLFVFNSNIQNQSLINASNHVI